ncbi:Trp family transcriptional regulator [Streptomyces sp. NPDC088353]|uniref:Trp family transcriptional regulator n=1 Tax=Streptomyces sp. NPDC088353 TaxID=3365855 RepID=UPI003826C76D
MSTASASAIAELLRVGATYAQVRATLGGASRNDIADVRRAEGIPVPERPQLCRTPEDSYALYAEPYGDGHARWTGPWAGRMPQVCHPGKGGRKESALRIAFRMRHGREPQGYVRPFCSEPDCVASGHLADRTIRDNLKRQSNAPRGTKPADPAPRRTPDQAAAMKIRADIAELLRAGRTYREICAELHVSTGTVTATRRALEIPRNPPARRRTDAERREETEQRHPRVAQMLREGKTYREITETCGISGFTVNRIRKILGIPSNKRRGRRTVAETLALYTQPHGDGHARWTGPTQDGRPVLCAEGRVRTGRREAFRAHHGRAPDGQVLNSCDEPGCIAGDHLTDKTIRDFDATYHAIFGDTA